MTIELGRDYIESWHVRLVTALSLRHVRKSGLKMPQGLFQFTGLPFGLHGALATFQRLMDEVLWRLSHFSCAYLDIVVYRVTWEKHLRHRWEVLNRGQQG